MRAGGFVTDQRLYGYEDWEMILHLIAEEEEVVFVPVVMGYYHLTPGSMFAETAEDKGLLHALLRLKWLPCCGGVCSPRPGTREWDPIRVGRIYNPAVGYID